MKTDKLITLFAASLITIFLTGIEARGQALYTSLGSGFDRDSYTGTVGVTFQATGTMVISELGFIDNNLDGNIIAHQVGLWNSMGTLLGSVTIPSGTSAPLIGEFRYESLATPITLASGSTYILGAYVQNGDGDIWQDGGVSFTLGLPVSNVGAAFTDTSFAYPGGQFPNNGLPYLGPNMIQVPEPTTLAALVLGFALLFSFGRLGVSSSIRSRL